MTEAIRRIWMRRLIFHMVLLVKVRPWPKRCQSGIVLIMICVLFLRKKGGNLSKHNSHLSMTSLLSYCITQENFPILVWQS